MIDTPARRREIIEILYFADDYVKIRPLAVRFGVSYATIRNDVDVLSLSYRTPSASTSFFSQEPASQLNSCTPQQQQFLMSFISWFLQQSTPFSE